jgi:hypothetical protein
MFYCEMSGNEDVHVEHPLFLRGPQGMEMDEGGFFTEGGS